MEFRPGQSGRHRAPGPRRNLRAQHAELLDHRHRRRVAGAGLHPHRQPDAGPVGATAHAGIRALHGRPGGAGPGERPGALGIPDGAPRSLGPRPALAAHAGRYRRAAGHGPGHHSADQTRRPVHPRPAYWRAHRAGRRDARAARHRLRRVHRAHAALFGRELRTGRAAARARHVGWHAAGPDDVPHPVPPAALRGRFHAAVGAGLADLPGQRGNL